MVRWEPVSKAPMSVQRSSQRRSGPALDTKALDRSSPAFRSKTREVSQPRGPEQSSSQVGQENPDSLVRAADSPHADLSDELPPLCPTLVLSACEARFAIAMAGLMNPSTVEFPIVGHAGNALIHASTQKVPGGRALELCVGHRGSFPLASIKPPQTCSLHEHMLNREFEIRGTNDRFYGHLRATRNTLCHLTRGSKSVMEIQGNPVSLNFIVLSKDGRELATANRTSDTFDGEEHLDVRVQPRIDAVLIILCILGMILVIPPSLD